MKKKEHLTIVKNPVDEISILLNSFCAQHLNEAYLNYSLNLIKRVKRRKSLSLNRGKKEIWAAAIVYVIARQNFLFDKANDYFLTADTICDFFGTKKSTSSNKASEIEKVCKIHFGEEGLCDQRIVDSLTFVQLENGIIIPQSMLTNNEIVPNTATGKNTGEADRYMEERRRKREQKETERIREKKEKREEINRKIAEEKKEKEERYQPNLFDE